MKTPNIQDLGFAALGLLDSCNELIRSALLQNPSFPNGQPNSFFAARDRYCEVMNAPLQCPLEQVASCHKDCPTWAGIPATSAIEWVGRLAVAVSNAIRAGAWSTIRVALLPLAFHDAEYVAVRIRKEMALSGQIQSQNPKKSKERLDELNVKARRILLDHADQERNGNPLSMRALGKLLGCSPNTVKKLPAWIAVSEKRPAKARRPKAIRLTNERLAVEEDAAQTLQRLKNEQDLDFEPSPFDSDKSKQVRSKKRV